MRTTSTIAGWGGLRVLGREDRSEDLARLSERNVLSRGLGRSYGDASLPPPSQRSVATTTLADRLLAFDETTGVLRAEAGTSLHALNRTLLPRGWFVPVTPGTQFVTLGGMVASDVHGKEHHARGCFGEHVTRLRMRVADGRIVECTDEQHQDLFRATIGGMGLTGHVLDVEVRLQRVPSPWILQHSRRVDDIDEYVERLEVAAARWPYTVGWIDCLTRGRHMGRGILIAGEWADASIAPDRFAAPRARVTMPAELPSFALSRPAIRLANAMLYAGHASRERVAIAHWESFFYPLDAVRHWNRMYGPRGFTQWQAVLPASAGRGAARRVLEVMTRRGGASFLCVIKDCGPEGRGLLSFPMKGVSIALDLPVRDDTARVIDALNDVVIELGGRIYLAKDQYTRREHFRAMEARRLPAFERVRDAWDPERTIRSAQSVRLMGDPR